VVRALQCCGAVAAAMRRACSAVFSRNGRSLLRVENAPPELWPIDAANALMCVEKARLSRGLRNDWFWGVQPR
jgi:hypothetical protein